VALTAHVTRIIFSGTTAIGYSNRNQIPNRFSYL